MLRLFVIQATVIYRRLVVAVVVKRSSDQAGPSGDPVPSYVQDRVIDILVIIISSIA